MKAGRPKRSGPWKGWSKAEIHTEMLRRMKKAAATRAAKKESKYLFTTINDQMKKISGVKDIETPKIEYKVDFNQRYISVLLDTETGRRGKWNENRKVYC